MRMRMGGTTVPPRAAAEPETPTPETAEPETAEATGRKRRLRRPRLPRPPVSRKVALGALALLLVAGAAAALIVTDPFGGDEGEAPAPKVAGSEKVEVKVEAVEAAASLGFPAFATANTTRVGGSDPEANAAAVALAVYPSAGDSPPPPAVTIVPDDPQAAIAASVLATDPVHAPVLIGSSDGVPSATDDAISALGPRGAPETKRAAVFAIGDVDVPEGLRATKVGGADPAVTAAAIARLRDQLLGGKPDHIVVAGEDPAFAAPAAAWAARSGDPVLFATAKTLPKPTAAALERDKDVPVFVLGPSSVIGSDVLRKIGRVSSEVHRVSGEDPVSNSVEFARYAQGSFGWNINDHGHGFVVASTGRPLEAAAASSLSAAGTWGPLLLTDSASELPGALRGYLLDVKPGYRSDPTRALYNHVWVIGDQEAIDVNQQAALDQLAKLARIGPAPGAEPKAAKKKKGKK